MLITLSYEIIIYIHQRGRFLEIVNLSHRDVIEKLPILNAKFTLDEGYHIKVIERKTFAELTEI